MGRPIYPYELTDPDFSWLISNFQENFPNYNFVENSCLPVVFIKDEEKEKEKEEIAMIPPVKDLDARKPLREDSSS